MNLFQRVYNHRLRFEQNPSKLPKLCYCETPHGTEIPMNSRTVTLRHPLLLEHGQRMKSLACIWASWPFRMISKSAIRSPFAGQPHQHEQGKPIGPRQRSRRNSPGLVKAIDLLPDIQIKLVYCVDATQSLILGMRSSASPG